MTGRLTEQRTFQSKIYNPQMKGLKLLPLWPFAAEIHACGKSPEG
jgi:hypothetical protein